jgi:hypothetical protein
MLPLRLLVVSIVLSVAVVVPAPVLALEADSADDVCAPDADPCIISEVVHVAPLANLDFGVRRVEIIDDGRLVFGRFGGTVSCGSFRATAPGVGVEMQKPVWATTAVIEARRACSGAVPTYP